MRLHVPAVAKPSFQRQALMQEEEALALRNSADLGAPKARFRAGSFSAPILKLEGLSDLKAARLSNSRMLVARISAECVFLQLPVATSGRG